MKNYLLYLIISIATAFVGCIFAVFVAEVFLNPQPLEDMVVAGLVIYLCIVVVFCTCLIMNKIK